MNPLKLSILPLVICLGCASKVARQQPEFTPLQASAPTPVSDYAQSRIYGSAGANAAPDDLKLGSEVRELFINDRKLAPPPSRVTISVHHGVVTLQGRVASPQDKKHIEEAVSQLPGVANVDNQLKVHWY